MKQVKNRSFKRLAKIGSRNKQNRVPLDSTLSNQIGVRVTQDSDGKAIGVNLLLPLPRNENGSRQVSELFLNGYQSRSLYEALKKFYKDSE
jgi:hypothetical protein